MVHFNQSLELWRGLDEGEEKYKYLCYILNYRYPKDELKSTDLKGDDDYRTRYVADRCKTAGDFCVLLANLRKRIVYEDYEGQKSEYTELEYVVDMEGFLLSASIPTNNNYILQKPPCHYSSGDDLIMHDAHTEKVYNVSVC